MRVTAVLCCALMLSGCAKWVWDQGRKANGPPLSYSQAPSQKTNSVNPDTIVGGAPTNAAISRSTGSATTPPPASRALNKTEAASLARALLAQADVNCENYLSGLSVAANTTASGLDIAALTLSSAASVTTPVRSAGILSALSSITGHARQTLSTDVLGNQDFNLLYNANIDGRISERAKYQAEIDKGTYENWTADAILADVQPYNYKCGINFARHYLSEVVETQSHPAAPVTATPPSIGTPIQVGMPVSVTNGTWTNTPTSFAYQWTLDGSAIAGATKSSYTPLPSDQGHYLGAEVAASNGGSTSATPAMAIGGGAVQTTQLPVVTTAPAITGNMQAGQSVKLGNGMWINTPTSYAYQWTLDGNPISGATAPTYTPQPSDVGHLLGGRVTASNATGASATPATATGSGIVLPAVPAP